VSLAYSFAPEARAELLEAIQYYESKSRGLGAAFLSSVEDGLDQLVSFPESAPILYRKVRRKTLRRFPYNLLYSIRKQEIRVLAVMNQTQRPFYWLGRK